MNAIENWVNIVEMTEYIRLNFNYDSTDCHDRMSDCLEVIVDLVNHWSEHVIETHS